MAVTISITINGTEQVLQRLENMSAGLTDFSNAMEEIGKELTAYFAGQVFADQGSSLGEAWEPLSMKYARRKAKLYPSKGILEATGTMRRSFTYTPSKDSVLIENTAPYFAYHQSSEARTKMPRRPMLGVNGDVQTIVQQLIEADIDAKIRSAA